MAENGETTRLVDSMTLGTPVYRIENGRARKYRVIRVLIQSEYLLDWFCKEYSEETTRAVSMHYYNGVLDFIDLEDDGIELVANSYRNPEKDAILLVDDRNEVHIIDKDDLEQFYVSYQWAMQSPRYD